MPDYLEQLTPLREALKDIIAEEVPKSYEATPGAKAMLALHALGPQMMLVIDGYAADCAMLSEDGHTEQLTPAASANLHVLCEKIEEHFAKPPPDAPWRCVDCAKRTSRRRGFAGVLVCDPCWRKRTGGSDGR